MNQLERLVEQLREVAKSDDVMTDEEYKVIKKISDFVNKYHHYLENLAENKIANTETKSKLKEMRKEVLEIAWVASMEDGSISDNESELISTIYQYLKKISF